MNMPFISSSEAKNAYFMSGEATNEIYIFSLHENSFWSAVKYSFLKYALYLINIFLYFITLYIINIYIY